MELSQEQANRILKSAADGTDPDPIYHYRFDPDILFTNAMAAPTLTVTNPKNQDGTGQQTIYVMVPIGPDPEDITAAAGGLTITTADRNWQVSPYLTAKPPYVVLTGPSLKALASVSFTFQNLLVSAAKGTSPFVIQESVSKGTVTKTIQRVASKLDIQSFYASPVTVTKGQETTLTWVVSGGSYVVLQPGSIRRDVKGAGAFTDSVEIAVPDPSQSYLLQLYTDDRQFTQAVTVAFVGSVMTQITSNAKGPISTTDPVTLTWDAEFADSDPKLVTPTKSIIVDRSGSMTLTPGSYLTGNASSVELMLTATGFGGPSTSSVTIDFDPVRIRWFRYTDMTKQAFLPAEVANPAPGWPQTTGPNDNRVLTTYGPGAGEGPLRAYLGDGPQLQVQVLLASPQPAAPGQDVVLTYATGNATSAALSIGLDQPSKPVNLDTNTQTGTTTIKAPEASTTLVLTVQGTDTPAVTSEFDLIVEPATT